MKTMFVHSEWYACEPIEVPDDWEWDGTKEAIEKFFEPIEPYSALLIQISVKDRA